MGGMNLGYYNTGTCMGLGMCLFSCLMCQGTLNRLSVNNDVKKGGGGRKKDNLKSHFCATIKHITKNKLSLIVVTY